MNSDEEQLFINRLNHHPKLRERMESLLHVVENTAGDNTKADDAERHVIEELRMMGSDALHCWAEKAVKKRRKRYANNDQSFTVTVKKSLLAHDLWRNHGHRASVSLHRPTV